MLRALKGPPARKHPAIRAIARPRAEHPRTLAEACRRYHEAHPAATRKGERAHLRHVLFAVTPGVDVKQLRLRAEALLIELRCADDGGAKFAQAAAPVVQLSQWPARR